MPRARARTHVYVRTRTYTRTQHRRETTEKRICQTALLLAMCQLLKNTMPLFVNVEYGANRPRDTLRIIEEIA